MDIALDSRVEQARWLMRKFGSAAAIIWAEFTDAELKAEFRSLYRSFKDEPDFVQLGSAGNDCILCDFEGWKRRYGVKGAREQQSLP